MMVVVTNLGSVSYLVKNGKYDFEKAVILLNEAVDLNNTAKNIKDLQDVRRHIVGGANRTLISAITSLRSCGIGTCRRLSSG